MSAGQPRVLMVAHGHPSLVPGGGEIAAHDLFRELDGSGLAEAWFVGCVTALHRAADPLCALQVPEGAGNELLLHVGAYDPFMLTHGADSRTLDDFTRVLDTVKPDIVHFHHLYLIGAESVALVRNRLPRARIVFTLHDFHPICHRDGLMMRTDGNALCNGATPDACHRCFAAIAPARFALRAHHLHNMMGLVDRFVAPSQFLMQRYIDWGLPQSAIAHIPNAVPETDRPLATAQRNRPRNRFAYFGNIAPHKGPLLLLDAAARLDRSLDLAIDFNGGMQFQEAAFAERFDRLLHRARPRVQHRGPYDRREVASLMDASDWIVVPSIWWENAPLTVLEAFRSRRPVIAADVGGMAELVDDGVSGLLFRRNDPADLARVITRAATETGLWDRLVVGVPVPSTIADAASRHAELYGGLLSTPERSTA